MSMNLFLNAVIGTVPGFGDLFSFWFKSNLKNLALIERHETRPGVSTTTDWVFVIGIVLTLLTVFVVLMLGTIWLLRKVWDLVA